VDPIFNRTASAREIDVQKQWFVVNAEGQVLGRLATQIARVLRGKHKPLFTPHIDCGDFVVVLNADKIRLTGRRGELKTYWRHSGYPGGDTTRAFADVLAKNPQFVIETAVRGMLPHNKLGRRLISKLKVYAGSEHPHTAQQPQPFPLEK
jgi:large subunit ribosomal protein L13